VGSSTGASSIAVMATSGTLAHTANVGLRVGATDTTPPTVAITAHPPGATIDSTATFSFMATDPDDPSSSLTSACSLDDSPFGACTSPTSYSGLAPGAHVFAVRSTDPAGNIGSGTFSWTVKAPGSGYWMLGSTGDVYAFGDAPYAGGAPLPSGAATAIAATPSGNGYRVVDSRGDVYAFGDAGYVGGSPPLRAGEQVTSLSSTPDGGGYWLFTNAGHAFAYGTARLFGDMAAVRLNGPVLGSVATPSGNGYSMVAADGGIFAFGDARFAGSMGDRHLNKPVVGMAPNPNGTGYYMVAADGGIFAFGPAFQGSMGSTRLNAPVIGMVSYGNGYLMVASDGGIFDFSDRAFRGSLGGNAPRHPVVAVTALNG
jgi:ribosomal protein L24E